MSSKQKRGARSPKTLTLLIITDEFGSSSNRNPETIKKHTSRHFAKFIELLVNPGFPEAVLIKNVGDSLMIRVQTSGSRQAIIHLLKSILYTQQELHDNGINIRVLVALLSDPNIQPLEGSSIYSSLSSELRKSKVTRAKISRKVPGKGIKEWLQGDLFGPPVARAFRASTIPKECNLIVESSVGELVYKSLSHEARIVGDLIFGPNVAFSPIRGMEDLYDIRRPKLDSQGRLDTDDDTAHVWLRTVKLAETPPAQCNIKRRSDKSEKEADPLIRRQQQTRVLTEFVLPPANPNIEESIRFWQKALSLIENKANYFRYVGLPLLAVTWINRKNEPPEEEKTPHARLVVLGAFPEFDTYFNIREAIHELNEQCASRLDKRLQFAQTTMLWSPRAREQNAPKYWRRLRPGKNFMVVMGRAHDDDRTDNIKGGVTAWHRIVGNVAFNLNKDVTDIGPVMGEWDYYFIYELEDFDGLQHSELRQIKKKCLKQILPHMARLRLYVCKVPEI